MRIGIIGTGEMGSGVGGWLAAHGADVFTSLDGRSAASVERVLRAGIADVGNTNVLARTCTIVLSIVPPDQAIGVAKASALKMCYGGMTKGIVGIGAAMFACAERAGVAGELAREFASSQAALDAFLKQHVPGMYPKAYRWVAEMREIASFGSDEPGVAEMYQGLAERYKAVAEARAADIGMA